MGLYTLGAQKISFCMGDLRIYQISASLTLTPVPHEREGERTGTGHDAAGHGAVTPSPRYGRPGELALAAQTCRDIAVYALQDFASPLVIGGALRERVGDPQARVDEAEIAVEVRA